MTGFILPDSLNTDGVYHGGTTKSKKASLVWHPSHIQNLEEAILSHTWEMLRYGAFSGSIANDQIPDIFT